MLHTRFVVYHVTNLLGGLNWEEQMKEAMSRNSESKTEIESVVREIRELAATVGWKYQVDDKKFRNFHFSPVSLQSEFESGYQTSAE
jgi:hypothetical protein